ncbi:MAG: D-2-hydroxyacid dehydrogenase [Pseudomonadota bacterium]
MTRIVFLDRSTMAPQIPLIKPDFEHEWIEHDRTSPDQIVDRLQGAEIAVTNKVGLKAAHIEALPDLKMIAIPATGYDAFDIAACKARGIVVSNVRGYAHTTVPEHVFALILALRRGIVGYRQSVIDGRWQEAAQFCYFDFPISDLRGQTLGIIGEGIIGQGVARIGQAFGMRTWFAAHKGVDGLGPLYTPFDQVIEEADILTVHAPLMPATRDTLASAEFARMTKKPLIINCGRGGLVNEADLVAALDSGQIAGAGFDCLTTEPPQPDNPLLSVLERPNVIVTPHTAWASDEAQIEVWEQVLGGINGYKSGSPINRVA